MCPEQDRKRTAPDGENIDPRGCGRHALHYIGGLLPHVRLGGVQFCAAARAANCHPRARGRSAAAAEAATAQAGAALADLGQFAGDVDTGTRADARATDRGSAGTAAQPPARRPARAQRLRPAHRQGPAECNRNVGRAALPRGVSAGDDLALCCRRLRSRRVFLSRFAEPGDACPPLRSQEP